MTEDGNTDPLSPTQVRTLLDEVLRTDADLEGFCLDFFPQVYRRFSNGMDRVSKVSLLFQQVPLVEIVNRLAFATGGMAALGAMAAAAALERGTSRLPLPIEEIFAHTGQPGVTYVETEQGRDLRLRLRKMGEGLVVEGPSGVGKTTAVRRALADLDQEGRTEYVLGTEPDDLPRLDELVKTSLPAGGHLVVDDFQRLDTPRQGALALLIKRLSDRNRRDAKVTLIGINPVGATLVQDLPEMQRYTVVKMRGQQSREEIEALISSGERAANIEFGFREEFIDAAERSFAIAQRLCYEAALKAGVTETAPSRMVIKVRPAEVQKKIHEDLGYRYRPLLLAFAACDASPPPRGAGLLLLWFLYKATDSSVVVQEVRYQYQHIGWLDEAFEWIRQSHLSRLFQENPGLRRLLYYNVSAGVLSAEDPHLGFYLRHLDWVEFARACGHNHLAGWDPDRGPLFRSAPGDPSRGLPEPARPKSFTSTGPFVLLHLSDLHFGSGDQAALWCSQLAADLRAELRIDRLDAVVLSGDITNRATQEEFHVALQFVRGVTKEFSLLPHQVIPVPGNHDLSWITSTLAYQAHVRKTYRGELREGAYYAESKDSKYIEVRDERIYKSRFESFAAFYQEVRREPYPVDPNEQGLIYYFPESEVLLLGLNSAWEIDHNYKARSAINAMALSNGLDEIRHTPLYQQSRIKIGVFHHPIGGADEARIKDAGFLERLAQAGFRAVLHGHLHEAADAEFRYYRKIAGLEILGAGTFGAAGPERPAGVPLQYQIIEIDREARNAAAIDPLRLRIRSRRRIKETGAWEPDHRYRQAPGEPNLDYMDIAL